MGRVLALAGIAMVLVPVSGAPAQETRRYETEDWILTAPASLVTQSDLALVGEATQICSDEIVLLTGHRPPRPAKFTVRWVVGSPPYSGAGPTGFVNAVPPTYEIVSDAARPYWKDRVASEVCFGPHEITHVLTWASWGQAWANEGFAQFTDRLYDSAEWGCCDVPLRLWQACDADGYTLSRHRYAYADLSDFRVSSNHYDTAACFWIEVHRLGGFPALRGILAGTRRRRPASTAELVVHQVSRILNVDVRHIAARYGFERGELEAGPAPRIPGCTLIGQATGDRIVGTAGADVICGLAGNDRLVGGAGADTLQGGAGNDTLNARDGSRDVVAAVPAETAPVSTARSTG
jgi:hypothetical protein